MNKNRLLIIDGSNLLFQMFYGMPSRIVNKDGKYIQGTLGFTGALLKIIKKTNPTHIVVLFDGEHENDRTKVNSEYKANRIDYSKVPEEDSPFSQLNDVYNALDYLNIKHTETTNCEVDDLIASYVITYGKEIEVIISSFDSDFFQLITDNVSVLRYRGDSTIVINPSYVKEKYNINPSQFADFKALVGDHADNIKGVNKVGAKTASLLLNEYGNLNAIIENVDTISKLSVKESIKNSITILKNNYNIIKLDIAVDIPFELDELKYIDNNKTTTEVLKGIDLK